jgi:hypothetical protein
MRLSQFSRLETSASAAESRVFLTSRDALYDAATLLLEAARREADVTDVSVRISEQQNQSVSVRKGELEKVQHSRSASASVTVFRGQRSASVTTSDLGAASPLPTSLPAWPAPSSGRPPHRNLTGS